MASNPTDEASSKAAPLRADNVFDADHGALLERWRERLPDVDASTIPLFAQAEATAQLLGRHYATSLIPFGVNRSEYLILAFLWTSRAERGHTPKEINRMLGQTSGGITQTLRRMKVRGWVRSDSHPEDKRSVLITLTDEGEALATHVCEAQADTQARKLAWLTEGQRTEIARALELLARALR